MSDEIKRVDYCYVTVPDKPGEGARLLASVRAAGINVLGISAFPHGARKSQVDFVPEDSAAFAKAAKSARLKLSRKKSGFLIQGEDRLGAVVDVMSKLAQANVNITSVQVFCAGGRPLRRHVVGQSSRFTQGRQGSGRRVVIGVAGT